MKSLKISLLIVIFVAVLGFFYISLINNLESQGNKNILSPLPKFLENKFYKEKISASFWKPDMKSILGASISKPEITAKSAISYDLTENKLLYEKNSKERLPIASLTKIMTAVVALDNDPLDKKITIDEKAATIGENMMGLTKGETLTLEELLYGLILPSGNDAAEAIAEGDKFGRKDFTYIMNKKAEELGMFDTHFTNPSGLEGDGAQYSTAYDLLVLTKYGISNQNFKDIVATVEYHIPYSQEHKEFYLYNETNLLTSYPGVKGVKIGFTDEAGYCIVTYLEHGKHKIVAVLLNSGNRRQEMKDLLDYSLKLLGETPPLHS